MVLKDIFVYLWSLLLISLFFPAPHILNMVATMEESYHLLVNTIIFRLDPVWQRKLNEMDHWFILYSEVFFTNCLFPFHVFINNMVTIYNFGILTKSKSHYISPLAWKPMDGGTRKNIHCDITMQSLSFCTCSCHCMKVCNWQILLIMP